MKPLELFRTPSPYAQARSGGAPCEPFLVAHIPWTEKGVTEIRDHQAQERHVRGARAPQKQGRQALRAPSAAPVLTVHLDSLLRPDLVTGID